MTPSRAGGVAIFALALAAVLWAVRHKFAIVTVAGDSMRPTLSDGDRVLVRRASMTQMRNGLVVVAERPAEDGGWMADAPRWPGRTRALMIKRVAALPGDPLPDLPEAAALALTADLLAESAQGRVPAGKLVLLGDNPAGSYDSRVFGYCPANRITRATWFALSPLPSRLLTRQRPQPRDDYHVAVIHAGNVGAALSAWPRRVESVTPLAGGWNSATWLVVTAQGRYVAKLVDDLDGPGLVSSLRIAEFLAARGLACGTPVRTRDGELTILLPEGTLALLQHEPGTPPDLSVPGQVRRAGRMLARAHQALRDFPAGSGPRYRWPWEWVAQCLDTVAMPEHVNAAARRVWPEIVRTVAEHQLSISVIHADPGPDGFLLGGDGAQDALIDWTTTLRGPLLYDLACFAVVTRTVGPHAARWFTEGYSAQMPEIGPQLAHLECLVKARWLANAIYFSARIERGIERGSDSPAANRDGLAAAYAGMTARA